MSEIKDSLENGKYKVNEECYHCEHMRRIPGDTHIGCTLHCVGNTFHEHGINNGLLTVQ